MTRIVSSLVIAAIVTLTAGAAHPQRARDYTRERAARHYDFDDDVVAAEIVRPDDAQIEARRAAKHSSLIRLRSDFTPELLASAQNM
jgi:hypothetical protein